MTAFSRARATILKQFFASSYFSFASIPGHIFDWYIKSVYISGPNCGPFVVMDGMVFFEGSFCSSEIDTTKIEQEPDPLQAFLLEYRMGKRLA